ncbi:MAG TPA: tetratricopeptide repeat protein [Bacteroidia bacterium]|nr:tetratricopeptide repeat protein [Bacteroidia bacterium]
MKQAIQLFGILLFFLVAGNAPAQSNIVDKGGDEVKIFNAQQAFNMGDYVKAVNLYKEVLANKPNDAGIIFHIGECFFSMNEVDKAQEQFEKAKSISSTASPDLDLDLGRCYQMKGHLDSAIAEFSIAKTMNAANAMKLKEIDYYLSQCQTAKSLMATPKPVTVTNLGANVNSPYDDKRPSITSDGKTLIFTSRRPDGKSANRDDEGDGGYFEDIYECSWDSAKMTWGVADLARGAVNTEGHDAACSISPDGRQMFLYVNNAEAGGAGDIYVSKRSSSGKWGTPKNMGKGINTSYFEDGAVLSPDGNTLYFMSERGQDLPWKGQKGYGHSDIWMCKKVDKNSWGDPVNLGPTINTEYDEGGIFPAPDGKTLYFCSNGHNSMGGYDIFMTRFENGAWTEPVNMGYPINTIANERMFLLTADGKSAYVDSDRSGGMGDRDLWIVDMTELLPKPHTGPYMSLLTGTTYDGDGRPTSVTIDFYDATGATKITSVTSSAAGNYQVSLEGDKTYEIHIDAPGFKPVKESVKLDADKSGATFELVKHFILYKQ